MTTQKDHWCPACHQTSSVDYWSSTCPKCHYLSRARTKTDNKELWEALENLGCFLLLLLAFAIAVVGHFLLPGR